MIYKFVPFTLIMNLIKQQKWVKFCIKRLNVVKSYARKIIFRYILTQNHLNSEED